MKKPLSKKQETEKRKAARAKKSAAKKRRQAAEQLWRDIVFTRAGRRCEAPGCAKGPFEKGDFMLQAHHIVKRSQSKRLQLDPLNGMALCAGHHQYTDRDPVWAMSVADELRPGTAKYLLRERRSFEQRGIDVEETILEQAWLELQEPK